MDYRLTDLPKEIRLQVQEYIEFLLYKYRKEQADQASNPRKSLKGIYKGKIQMSEDFDAPLDDFKDYM
ncbi:MAG: DUF2281 domain-containing protein [Bacteroidota bacterium]